MGTVGLSFGSPTSGAGFDVSTTVSSIVANLQNVETPWKTQLTSLESQDTAISSLGTLFSNLSNDMSALTDLEGIMAEKTGSSSDTNVLSLTAATSSAIAGTHTVEVTNLAQTSSGYLAPITDASDTLSGSITLQVGTSGTPQTITLGSTDDTLAELASAINSSGVGITASVLTDASGSRLSLVSGTSGADGNMIVSSAITDKSNTISTSLSYGGTTGASSGSLSAVANASDTLSGNLSIQVGSGTAQTIVIGAAPSSGAAANTIYTGSGVDTLSGIASAITNAGMGVTASVVNNALSLSVTSGTGALAVTSNVVDTSHTMSYTSTVSGSDANLTVDGIALTSASNTVANLIPGVTFQLLAPSSSGEQVQVVIGNDNSGVESTVSQMVSDYNSLVSAINTQEGNTSSGTPEPLFGSPTLSLLQQQLLGSLNMGNANGYLTPITVSANTALAGTISIQAGSGTTETVTLDSSSNTLAGLAAAINEANGSTTMTYAGTAGSDTVTSTGTLSATGCGAGTTLSGSMTIQVGDGTTETIVLGDEPTSGAAANTIYTGNDSDTLATLASAITSAGIGVSATTTTTNGVTSLSLTSGTTGSDGTLTVTSSVVAAGSGVTASVVTTSGQSSLSLISQTEGSAITVNSSVVATTPTALSYSDTDPYTDSTADTGTLTGISNEGDTLTGSISIQVGTGAAQTVTVDGSSNTLQTLAQAINNTTNIGVTASVVEIDGAYSLQLQSNTTGADGALTVKSNIADSTSATATSLGYVNSSDINNLSSLGISVNNDGTMTFDAASLDSVLNTDYSGVMGFFQDSNSWGQNFSTILTNSGSSSSTGILSLASSSNSNIESTLNADITKEESLISAQQKSLTAELNSANEIMQELPSQLDGVNELYSAITGYNQSTNG
jgi:flagellar hook-associated protein 2